ncbi:MAG: TlpA family protein disulfide reductase [Anaerolineae bacterium]|nr:TlpA family protein disulfide reductase [Anaerolineae bacterium]
MTDTIQPTENPTVGTEKSKPKFRVTTILLWVAVIGILALVGWGLINANKTRPEAGQTAPGFTVHYFDGYEWENASASTLEEMKGKVVVLNFWASWCVECRVEADLLEQASRQYANEDVVFLGVAYADVEPNSIEYLKEFGITYPNAPDLGTSISSDYEITGVPETFFIGKDGVIANVVIGPVNGPAMMNTINTLLAEGGSQ